MAANFKTTVFGGFDKEDVISFIEKTSHENQEKVTALEESCEALRQENAALTEKLASARQEADALRDGGPARIALEQKLSALSERAAALEAEVDALRTQAGAYQDLKNHIADIEISAHRRTEEFRAAMVEQMRSLLSAQRAWCGKAGEEYAAANRQMLDSFQQALSLMSEQAENARQLLTVNASEPFTRFAGELSELERALDEDKGE